MSTERASDIERVALTLKALGNANRLALLWALRDPARPRAAADAADVLISDTAVRKHLDELREAGLLRLDGGGSKRETVYTLDPRAIFLAVDHLRQLGSVRGLAAPFADGTPTTDGRPLLALPPGPQFVLVRGLPEGRVFPLGEGEAWTIGRDRTAAILLTADPFVSKAHAVTARRKGRFMLQGLPSGKNGTAINGSLVAAGRWTALASGDLVGVGRSLLLFRGDDLGQEQRD